MTTIETAASDFSITLLGRTFEEAEVREAFELAVRIVRGALEEASLSGELVLAGLTYPAADVPETPGTEPEDDGDTPPIVEDDSEG